LTLHGFSARHPVAETRLIAVTGQAKTSAKPGVKESREHGFLRSLLPRSCPGKLTTLAVSYARRSVVVGTLPGNINRDRG
jgi:hypothetical protein